MLEEGTNKVFRSAPQEVKKGATCISIPLGEDIIVQGDVKFEFFSKPKMMRKVFIFGCFHRYNLDAKLLTNRVKFTSF